MNSVTKAFFYNDIVIPSLIYVALAIYLIIKICKKLFKKIPFVNITKKIDLHKDIKKHIKKHHKKYELTADILIPLLLLFSIIISKDCLLALPKVIQNNYELLNCIALEDATTNNAKKYSQGYNIVNCNCEGEKIKIRYVSDTLKVKKWQKIKVSYLRNVELGTIIE